MNKIKQNINSNKDLCISSFNRKTKYKKLVVCLQFPNDYPNNPIIIEIKSKTLPEKLCNGFTNICDAEAKKAVGKPHVSSIIEIG